MEEVGGGGVQRLMIDRVISLRYRVYFKGFLKAQVDSDSDLEFYMPLFPKP